MMLNGHTTFQGASTNRFRCWDDCDVLAGHRVDGFPSLHDFCTFHTENKTMSKTAKRRAGKIKYALFGWLIGLPLPIIFILLFVRGCDF